MPQPFANFQSLETHHCVTGSMRHLYVFNDHPLSEELLLGLGEGVGYIYWHQKGQMPFMGGRNTPKPSLEELTGQRTGVHVTIHTTTSARKAETALLEQLENEIPVMLQVDMGFLPYFDFGGEEYHFGGHLIVACGYDSTSGTVLIADRDAELHPVSLEALAQARGSQHQPFPPKHAWYTFDFTHKRGPSAEEIFTAIVHQVRSMLTPPISNFGVPGIRKTAKRVITWPEVLTEKELRNTLFNTYIFISPVGGSGGGLFRYMFNRFLIEAADLTGCAALAEIAPEFQAAGDRWETFGHWCQQLAEAPDPRLHLSEAVPQLHNIAAQENHAWTQLAAVLETVDAVPAG
jgi:hypothetical protein